MKILLFYFAELGGLGGVDVLVMNLVARFTAAGQAAGVLEVAPHKRRKRLLSDGAPVWTLTAPSYPTITRPRSWASCARATAQFLRVIREFGPDVVHVHFPLIQCIPLVYAHFLPHKYRLVVTLHNSEIRVAPFHEPAIRPWQARLFARADAVTTVNQAMLDDAIAMFPVIAKKGHVILNGVGPEWFQTPADRNHEEYILFAGRLSHVKGVDLLLKAWSQVSPRFPQAALRIAGDGDQREALESMARELGIAHTVRFLGRKSREELRQLYSHAQGVVLPSRREGLPLSLLEAGASGAICVGSQTAGIPEIIEEGVTGYVVNAEAADELGRGIERMLTLPPGTRKKMKEAAQAVIRKRFSQERMIANYLELFISLLRSSR